MEFIHGNRWYRYGEVYGNRTIVSKITKEISREQTTLYLTLCQCGNLLVMPLQNAKRLSNKSVCEECVKNNKYGYRRGKMPSDETIYSIFKSKEEK